jgi:hypothetical protein
MKVYNGSLVVTDEAAQTIYGATGATEDEINEQFGMLAADLERGMREGVINNMGEALAILSKHSFFFQHMMTVGILQFLSNYTTAIVMVQKEKSKE